MPDAPRLEGAEAGHARHPEHAPEHELVREGATMALYVSVCLLAVLETVEPDAEHQTRVLLLVWGTTLGLAFAHWFAFRLSARMVAHGTWHRADAELAGAQLAGAGAVAAFASLPILVAPPDIELLVARLTVGSVIAGVAYVTARSSGAARGRSIAYAAVALAGALLIAIVKNLLAGH